MGKIVAIGGGENGHHGTKYETAVFDKEIIVLTGKETPNFLFIGLANPYPDYYFNVMDGIYREMYGCNTDYLTYEDIRNKELSSKKIEQADIIYVGGGNTHKLMLLLRRFGIDEMLKKAYFDDKVMCGVSAGAICWCSHGNSDSRKISTNSNQQIRVRGLGFVDILFCPHYVKQKFRADSLKEMMKKTYRIPAVGLDNAALEIVDGKYKILKLEEGAVAKKCYWKRGIYIDEDIYAEDFRPLKELLEKY